MDLDMCCISCLPIFAYHGKLNHPTTIVQES